MDKKFMDDLKKCSTKEEVKIFIDDIIDTEIDLQVYNNDFIGIESSVNPLCNFIQNKSESALINSSVVSMKFRFFASKNILNSSIFIPCFFKSFIIFFVFLEFVFAFLKLLNMVFTRYFFWF